MRGHQADGRGERNLAVRNLVVMIVEDHAGVRDVIERMVEQWSNVEFISVDSFTPAIVWIHTVKQLDVLLCDVCLLGDMGGVEIAALAVATHPSVAVVLFSADRRSDVAGMRDEYNFLQKPFGREELMIHIDQAFVRLNTVVRRA